MSDEDRSSSEHAPARPESARNALEKQDEKRRAAEATLANYLPGDQLYAIDVVYGEDGDILQVTEQGDLTPQDVRNVARPYGLTARRSGYLYHEAESVRSDGTSIVRRYEVRREEGFPPELASVAEITSAPKRIAVTGSAC